jgi:hypothetical protein
MRFRLAQLAQQLWRKQSSRRCMINKGHMCVCACMRSAVQSARKILRTSTSWRKWKEFELRSTVCRNNNKYTEQSRSQWPRGLRRGSAAARLLGLWVRIPPRAWISVCCGCCVLSGRGLCDELVTRPEESYRVWCVEKVWSWSLEKWGGLGPQGAVEPLGGWEMKPNREKINDQYLKCLAQLIKIFMNME